MKLFIFLIYFFSGLTYLCWRLFFTVNNENLFATFVSSALYATEVYSFLAAILLIYISAAHKRKNSPGPESKSHPAVNIFITTDNNSIDDLQKTIIACKALNYPAGKVAISIIDRDGRNDGVERLAKKHKCRPVKIEKEGACLEELILEGIKGLPAELVMLLKCGHVPVKSYLKKTVPSFEDEKVAFVRTPCHNLSSDPLQQALILRRDLSNEKKLYEKVVEPGLDRFRASTPSWQGIIFRKEALRDALSDESVKIGMNIRMNALLIGKGWKPVYLNNNLIFNTSLEEEENFFRKRAWKFTRSGRLFIPFLFFRYRLSLSQRLAYMGLIMNELNSLPRVLYMIVPLFFMTGLAPFLAPIETLSLIFIPFFILQIITLNLFSRSYRHPLFAAVYDTAGISSILIALTEKLFGRDADSLSGKPVARPLVPLIALWALQLTGLITGSLFFLKGIISQDFLMTGAFWILYNMTLLTAAIASVYGRPRKRGRPRIFREVQCRLISENKRWDATSIEISESGISLIMSGPEPIPGELDLEIQAASKFQLSCKVMRNEVISGDRASVGLMFVDMSERQKERLIEWIYCEEEEWFEEIVNVNPHRLALEGLLTSAARVFTDEIDLHRKAPRYNVQTGCRILLPTREIKGTTVDASSSGILVKVAEEPGPLLRDIIIEIDVKGKGISYPAKTAWTKRTKDSWLVALMIEKESGSDMIAALFPLATIKVVKGESFQTRVVRTMARMSAYLVSLVLAGAVLYIAVHAGIFSLPPPDIKALYHFFWLFVVFILIDGLKVFIEIVHRATPREYKSDISRVTALVPCYNTGKAVEYTIEGLLNILPKDQILIIDDGSSDDTAEIARQKGVRVHSMENNSGKVKAVYEGLKKVRTRYTLLLDDDVRLQNTFLPTSLLEEGNTGVAFYVLPCRRVRENYNGKDIVSCLQRYEYAKSMEIGRRFQDKTVSVSCISGAVGLFNTEKLMKLEEKHSGIFPGEDFERTLINLLNDGKVAFVNDNVWTVCPDNLKDLTKQRLFSWYPGYYRLAGFYLKILFLKNMPARLRFEMLYNFYVILSDPLKIFSLFLILYYHYWGAVLFLYFFYLALEVYPFLVVEKKLPLMKYYFPAFILFPLYGIYSTFLRVGGGFVWLWHRFVTGRWKPVYEKVS
ncbi:MAG: glycosyltransferase [Deltaproteobacteria bacterium]|nr:glycosyltransferase [Deltaproteobacteria bacterium]